MIAMLLLTTLLFVSGVAAGQMSPRESIPLTRKDSLSFFRSFIHRIEIEGRPGYIAPLNPFLEGENQAGKSIDKSLAMHLKYSLQFHPDSYCGQIYNGAYQGIGVAHFDFGNRNELGAPTAVYLFQGAQLARLTNHLTLNYEWNFGLSFGWQPYNFYNNYYNRIIGSKRNAYINMNVYFDWMVSRRLNVIFGFDATHFSNGNTRIPNGGLNTIGMKAGLAYNFSINDSPVFSHFAPPSIPAFRRHVSYDLTLFGAWRRKGVEVGDEMFASPYAYMVLGFNFAPMYNFGYKFRLGVSVDGVYDGSANVYTADYIVGTSPDFRKPPASEQLALGLSARAEYVMPYFTVGIGLGVNVLYAGKDLKAFYQILALKTEITRNSFIHIGYTLHNFHTPSFLMLGIGVRFNNKYPTFHR